MSRSKTYLSSQHRTSCQRQPDRERNRPADTPLVDNPHPVAQDASVPTRSTSRAEASRNDDSESFNGGVDTPDTGSDKSDGEDIFKHIARTRLSV